MASSEIRRRPAGRKKDPDDADVRRQRFAHDPAGSRRGPPLGTGLEPGWNRAVTAVLGRGRLCRGASNLSGRAAVAGGLAAFRPGIYDVVFEQLRQVPPLLQRIGGSQTRRDGYARQRVVGRVAGLAAE